MVRAPARLRGAVELMDRPGAHATEIWPALSALARINRLLGGVRLVRGHLARLLPDLTPPVRVLDVGTGYADIPRALVRWARRRGLCLEIEGLDHSDEILQAARAASAAYPEIRLRRGDALALPYPDESFDLVLASLLIHHMEGEEPVQLLRELFRVARRGMLVNDLRRGRWPLAVTRAGLSVLSRSPLIRHDGPLSIRRAFLVEELLALAQEAGWKRVRVSRHPVFRLALVGEKA